MVLGHVSRRALLVGGWSILGVPVLAACLGRGKKKDGSSGGSGSAGASGGSGQGVTRTVTTVGATLKVTVGPAVVSDDVMVVPLAVHLDKMGSGGLSSDGKKFDVHLAWSGTGNFTGADGVRLVDFDAGTVQETFKASSESTGLTKEEPDTTLHALFKPVSAKTINILVPESGLFEGVPVVRDGKLSDEAKKALEDVNKTESSPDPVALETFTASVDGASDTRVTGKSVVINLASDVLFASDSADLSAQADATLNKAAEQLATYPGGEVSIVGHTDDVADDAHNLDLSKRRATSVSDRLGRLTNMSAFSVSTDGKGESSPRAPNDSDGNRQLNRRVEITLVPTQAASSTSSPDASKGTGHGSGDLPKAEGPVAKGSEGVTVKRDGRQDELTFVLTEVTRRGKYLVGEVKATGGPGGTQTGPADWLQPTQLAGSARGEEDNRLTSAVTGLSLLTPQTRYYPADYTTARGSHCPLSEITADNQLGAGDATTLTVVWPDTGQDTVTLDLQPAEHSTPSPNNPFRLTDIPVKR